MAQLAIKGHPTRGKEVIQLLETLGGSNFQNLYGDKSYAYYTINSDKEIKGYIYIFGDEQLCSFTLEEFLEKFPYKVGDKVIAYAEGCLAQFTIQGMRWNYELNKVEYKICSSWCDTSLMIPYKEETMEEKGTLEQIDLTSELLIADEVEVVLGDYEFVLKDGKTYFVKTKPKYPKTYKECCEIVNANPYIILTYDSSVGHRYSYDVDNLQHYENIRKLLICRDAYWEIAGEQMGLGKPWKQDYDDRCFIIANNNGNIYTYEYHGSNNAILAFPTAEMRDAFYENFKDLIEQCKELL